MYTKGVADFILATNFNRLPSNVITKAKLAILDTLGVSIVARDTKSAQCILRVVLAMGGKKESTLLGVGKKVPTILATLANSVLANACDMDDGTMVPEGHLGHFGATVIPSAISVAEASAATGRDLIEAIVVGYEIAIRTGSILLGMLRIMTSGPINSYGAAATAGKLLHLNAKELADAFAIVEVHNLVGIRSGDFDALIQAGGFKHWGMAKEGIGWSTMTGVAAAFLAREGFSGLIPVYDRPDINQAVLNDLGKEYKMLRNYHKAYSGCRYTHAILDGVLALIQRHHLIADDISKVIIGVSSTVTQLNVRRPSCIEEAQMSVPFLIGVAVLEGKVTPTEVNENRLNDKAILNLVDKVELEVDSTIDTLWPVKFGAVVKIKTKNGQTHETRIDSPKGDVEDPFTADELKEKFMSLSVSVLGEKRARQVLQCVDNLENVSNVKELIRLVI